MPRYDYVCPECGFFEEVSHSIKQCDEDRQCSVCTKGMVRKMNAPYIEGSFYPFKFWNAKMPDGQFSVELNNKTEHREFLARRGLDSPVVNSKL